jgi:hypothetical protein
LLLSFPGMSTCFTSYTVEVSTLLWF